MFDSPFEFCPRCEEIVLLDQARHQCALEHHCAEAVDCPLRRWFTGVEFGRTEERAAPERPRPR